MDVSNKNVLWLMGGIAFLGIFACTRVLILLILGIICVLKGCMGKS